jgi:hypothetical protein
MRRLPCANQSFSIVGSLFVFHKKSKHTSKEGKEEKSRSKEIKTTQNKKMGKLRRKHVKRRLRERAW